MQKIVVATGLAVALLLTAAPVSAENGLVAFGRELLLLPNVAATEAGLLVCQQRFTRNEQERKYAHVPVEGPRQAWGSCWQRWN